MATQSPPPPPNPINPEPSETAVKDGQATPDPPQENSQTSVFVNSEPIREEQVQNAIKFLSHPRVRGSPVIHRRNFLEKKGLTKEEIDEAFRRVPDPSPAATSGQTSTPQDAQVGTATNVVQAPVQAMQPVAAAPSGVISTMTRRFHWSHAVFAIGFLTMSGVGTVIVLKNSVIPRLKSWIRRVVLDEEDSVEGNAVRKPTLAEEATAAAKAAAAAAADVARASQEMLLVKNEEKKCFAEFMSLLDVQIHEMRTMRSAISKIEGQSSFAGRNHSREEYLDGSITRSMQAVNGKYEYDTRSVRSVSPPVSAEPPHPKSYAEIMAMVQRGEKPPNVRDIDDRPPNPNQPISNPSMAPRSKPWETTQPIAEGSSGYSARDNGSTYQYNNDDISSPWWQQKNVRITEVENGNDHKYAAVSTEAAVADRPPVRRWVPPQPPPVSMPEAAIAIRQPKASSIPKDSTPPRTEEEAAQPVSGLEELQRVTKISESGGQLEMNGGAMNSEMNYSEIQEEVTEV